MDFRKIMTVENLGSWDFQENEQKVLQIKNVIQKKIFSQKTNKEELTPVLLFTNYTMNLVLNAKNQKIILSLLGHDTDKWINKKIALQVVKVLAFGKMTETVRIIEKLPAQTAPQTAPPVKEDFNENHTGWQAAINSLIGKTVTMEQIKGKYLLTPENEQKLIELSTIKNETNEESVF
jgi:hypothetical protein